MGKRKVTFETVRDIGLKLPDVEDGTMYGKSALKVRGKLLTCLALHKSAEPDSLVVRIDLDQRAGLLAEAPETYYITDHYLNYPAVLARLGHIEVDQLRDLLNAAWRFVTTEKSGTRPGQAIADKKKSGHGKARMRLEGPNRAGPGNLTGPADSCLQGGELAIGSRGDLLRPCRRLRWPASPARVMRASGTLLRSGCAGAS